MVEREIELAADGDRAAAHVILSRLLPRVRHLTRYLVRGDSDADDLVQECLILILRGLKSFRGNGSLESWVDRIVARHVMANRKKRRRLFESELRLEAMPAEGNAPDAREDGRRTVDLLDRLPEAQRYALVLHHVLEMSVTEVSGATGVPVETVRTRLRRGRALLLELSKDEGSR